MTGERAAGRRLVGALVLVLVLAGLVLSNRVSATRVAGTPVAVWPQPPPVGSCVSTRSGVAVVPCDERHDAEVTAAYGPLEPMVTDTARDPMYDPCDAAAKDYLGADAAGGAEVPGTDGWRTAGLAYSVEPMTAPPDQRAGAYAWQVCLIRPAVPARYSGTVRGATTHQAPAAYRTCLDAGGWRVSCDQPHSAELLAIGVSSSQPLSALQREDLAALEGRTQINSSDGPDQQAPADPAAAMLAEQLAAGQILLRAGGCPDVARWLLNTDDPTYGGRLKTLAGRLVGGFVALSDTGSPRQVLNGQPSPVQPSPAQPRQSEPDPAQQGQSEPDPMGQGQSEPDSAGWDQAIAVGPVGCAIRATEGRTLTGSLVGNGNRPPALTGG